MSRLHKHYTARRFSKRGRMNKSELIQSLRSNPFRLFFPLGVLFALIGVGEWVFWSVGWSIPAVSFTHASLQAQGFLSCFVVGFLMTAFPRFTGTEPAHLVEIGAGLLSALAFLAATVWKEFAVAQMCFLALILTLMVFAIRRFPHRSKPLPPSFLLMGFGFLHALTGPLLVIASGLGDKNIELYTLGRQMTQLGFLLCMVLGITGQLAPFLMGYTADPEQGDDFRKGRLAFFIHGFSGALLYASFWMIPWMERPAHFLRAVVVTAHLLLFARIARPVLKKTALIYFFTLSMWLIPAGLWTGAALPVYRIAALHFVFIGGFSLMIFSFGQLIVLSHSLEAALLNGRLIPLKIVGTTVVAATLMRVAADFFSGAYMILIHLSSGFWVLAAAFWLANLWPKMFFRKKAA